MAFWPVVIFVGRLAGDSETVHGSSRLIEVCAAWLVFAVLAYGWYQAVRGRLLRAHQTVGSADSLES
jgi:hypothetical protein